MIELIVSQGRVGDRAANMIAGAYLTAEALQKKYGMKIRKVGTPSPHKNDDWSVSLPQAKQTLLGIKQAITDSIQKQNMTIMLSNTCSVSLASLPVVAQEYPDAFILWIDAHGDFNTPETTDSGYLGGMVVAGACGLWDSGYGGNVKSNQVIIMGGRDIDKKEEELLKQSSVKVIPPKEVTAQNILKIIGDKPVWIHIDWDVLEPGYLPADYSVPNGLTPAQIKEVICAIGAENIRGLELAEFNASQIETENEKALEIILDLVSPLFDPKE